MRKMLRLMLVPHQKFGDGIQYRTWHNGPTKAMEAMSFLGKVRFVFYHLRGWRLDDWNDEGVLFVKGAE